VGQILAICTESRTQDSANKPVLILKKYCWKVFIFLAVKVLPIPVSIPSGKGMGHTSTNTIKYCQYFMAYTFLFNINNPALCQSPPQSNTLIPRPTPLTIINGIQIQSAILPLYTLQTNWQKTDKETSRLDWWQVCTNTHSCSIDFIAMRLIINTQVNSTLNPSGFSISSTIFNWLV